MGIPGELVDDHEDRVETGGMGKAFDEIHRDHLPSLGWHGQRLKETWVGDALRLGLLAGLACFDEQPDMVFESRPCEQEPDSAISCVEPRMASNCSGMQSSQHLFLEIHVVAQPHTDVLLDNAILQLVPILGVLGGRQSGQ